jgi:hypothetical protein
VITVTALEQQFLPLSGDAADANRDIVRLAAARSDSARKESRLIVGKRLQVFTAISRAARGLTMREMAAISGRGINCWTQPFSDLRAWGIIETTEERRDGGTVHRLKKTISVNDKGEWA